MNEQQFKEQFYVQFLAAWVANRYDYCCASGAHEQLKHPPIEDAEHLANAAWTEHCENFDGFSECQ